MKKSLLVLVMMLIGSASYAQGLHPTDEGLDLVVLSMELDGAAMASMEMKQELSLTEEQFDQVAQLNNSRYQQLQQAESSFTNDSFSRSKEFRSIQLENDRNLKSVLTPRQLREYQRLEGRLNLQLLTENEE
ncbi:hypothetical protein [Pontibacter flavimaris]|uniref:DUF4168 domain-containing protein n=1 Tax=Pontibacter flavimaris TaxID=1797110 RepID=A0A1Q5PBD7_9BACT|nr:hypothetical protein [Pontibacter flavimaris]OKL39569.1 hypothetical protein A3841_01080 [Pontibacter flavimaris]